MISRGPKTCSFEGRRRRGGTSWVLALWHLFLWLGSSGCSSESDPDGGGRGSAGAIDRSALVRCAPEDGEAVATDEEIQRLAGCQLLEGILRMGPEVTDLSPLSSLVVIERSLAGQSDRTDTYNFDALSSLRVIDRLLVITDNACTSLAGLSSLEKVDSLVVRRNEQITDMRGMERLEEVSLLAVSDNAQLVSLDGLEGLRRVNGDVEIALNPRLPQSVAEAFVDGLEVSGNITVQRNRE